VTELESVRSSSALVGVNTLQPTFLAKDAIFPPTIPVEPVIKTLLS